MYQFIANPAHTPAEAKKAFVAAVAAAPKRNLAAIARAIRADWATAKGGIYFGAKPYLDAMSLLNSLSDTYGSDSARSIVNYFLANASTYRGDTARWIKEELKQMLAAHDKVSKR